jgi:hypothetical protein
MDDRVRLRSEAEAPWRSLRFLFFGTSVASAGLALLFNIPQLIGAAAGAPNAAPLEEVLQNVGINAAAAGLFAFLFAQDWKVWLCNTGVASVTINIASRLLVSHTGT